MLEILTWAGCVLIVGIGYCGMYLAKIASKKEKNDTAGAIFFGVMTLLAVFLFFLSFVETSKIQKFINQVLR